MRDYIGAFATVYAERDPDAVLSRQTRTCGCNEVRLAFDEILGHGRPVVGGDITVTDVLEVQVASEINAAMFVSIHQDEGTVSAADGSLLQVIPERTRVASASTCSRRRGPGRSPASTDLRRRAGRRRAQRLAHPDRGDPPSPRRQPGRLRRPSYYQR